jgi:hypothetical protein
MKKGRPSSASEYSAVGDILELFLDPIRGKLGKDYDAELVFSSKGNYIYHCRCGITSLGNLKGINMLEPYIPCLDCHRAINISNIDTINHPRFYKLKFDKSDGIEKIIVGSSEKLEECYAIALRLKRNKDGWIGTD